MLLLLLLLVPENRHSTANSYDEHGNVIPATQGAMNMCERAREMRVEKYLVAILAALDTAERMLGMQSGGLHNGSDIE